MKKFIIGQIVLLCALVTYGQGGTIGPFSNVNATSEIEFNSLRGNPNEVAKISGVIAKFDNINITDREVEGDKMLLKEDGEGIILVNNKRYKLKYLNFDVEKNAFVTRITKDSVFIFDTNLIDRVRIEAREFVNYPYNEGVNRKVVEIITEGDKFGIYKSYYLKLIERSPNPMVNRKNTKAVKKNNYWIRRYKEESLVPFKVKKSNLFDLIKSSDDRALVKNFIKKNRLSVKEDNDLKKIILYMNNL